MQIKSSVKLFLVALFFLHHIDGSSQYITTIAGNFLPPDNVSAISSPMYAYTGTIDSNGNIYFVDHVYNNTVRKIDVTGMISTVAGNGIFPDNVFAAASGDLFITDHICSCVRKIDRITGLISIVAGGSYGYNGDGIPATTAALGAPASVFVDQFANIFIADSFNHRIRKVDAVTGIITTVAGTGVAGFSGDNGSATSAQFNYPISIFGDISGNLFIADRYNYRIRKIDAATQMITTICGTGSLSYNGDNRLASTASLNSPIGIWLDVVGNIYISEYNSRIRKINSVTNIITTIAGNGVVGFAGDGGLATSAQIFEPYVLGEWNGEIYFADHRNNRIRKIDANGIITTAAGNGFVGYFGDGGPATSATMAAPSGSCLDRNGNLIVADFIDNCVLKIDKLTGIISRIAGNGLDHQLISTNNIPALSAQIPVPTDVSVDNNGNIYISTNPGYVYKVDPAGLLTIYAGTGILGYNGDNIPATSARLYTPQGIWVDSQGNLFIADSGNSRIRKVDAVTKIITTVAGTGVAGYNGDNILATLAKVQPRDISGDQDGNLYVSDTYNNRLRKIDKTTGKISTIAGNGNYGYVGDGGLAVNASFTPYGMVMDPDNNIYISTGSLILRIDDKCKVIRKIAGDGNAEYNGDNIIATSASMDCSTKPIFDSGNLLISDYYNRRIRKVDSNGNQVVTFNPLSPVSYATAPFAPDAIASSGLPVTFRSADTNIATVNPITGLVTPHGIGTTTIFASQPGSAQFLPATDGCQTLTVNKALLNVSPTDIAREYGEPNPPFNFTYSGFANGEGQSVLDSPPLISTTATQSSNVGGYPITLSGGSDNNYDFHFNIGTLTINKATLNVLADDKTKVYGDTNPQFSLNYSGFKLADDNSVIDTAPTSTTIATQFSSVGNYPITPFGGLDNNYNFIFTDGTLAITQRSIEARADDLTMAYGDQVPPLTSNLSPALGVPITLQTTATSTSEPGIYPITLSNSGPTNSNYIVSLSPGTLTVNKAALIISPTDLAREYGDPNPSFTFNYIGFVNGESQSVIDNPPLVSTTATQSSNVGGYPITFSGGSDNNYDFHFNIGTLTINKATLNVRADDKTKVYGDTNPQFTVNYSGFKLTDDNSVIDIVPTSTTVATQFSPVGDYPITPSGGLDNNYDFIFTDGTLSISQASLQVKANDLTMAYGDPVPSLTTDLSQGFGIPLILQTTATSTSEPGIYPITLTSNEAHSQNYTISLSLGNLTVTKAPLAISADPKSRKYGESNPELTMTYHSFRNNERPDDLDSKPIVSTSANALSPLGEYPINLIGGSDNHYDFLLKDGTLTIECGTVTKEDLPNVITPNGDNKNDFFIVSQKLTGSYLEIHNRWGGLVYKNPHYDNSWSAQGLSEGTYYFRIRSLECIEDIKGWIQVLR